MTAEAPSATLSAAIEAAERYRASLGPDFEPCAVTYAAGRALDMAGRPDLALEVWLDALDEPTARGWPYLMNALVSAARRLGQERAIADRLAARAEALPELHLWRGHLLRLAGEPELALPCLERAWRLTEGELRFTAATERLQALVELGRLDEAIMSCQQAMSELPERSPSLTVSLGGLLCRAGQADRALEVLDELVSQHPTLALAHLNRGAALMQLGRREEAQGALQLAVSLDASTRPTALRLGAAP